MTQNKKRGIAKKAISISLVAAMLATSNVPVWASGDFSNEAGAVDAQTFTNEVATDSSSDSMLSAAASLSVTLTDSDINNNAIDLDTATQSLVISVGGSVATGADVTGAPYYALVQDGNKVLNAADAVNTKPADVTLTLTQVKALGAGSHKFAIYSKAASEGSKIVDADLTGSSPKATAVAGAEATVTLTTTPTPSPAPTTPGYKAADITALQGKLADFAWDQAQEKMADALAAAKNVHNTNDEYTVKEYSVGLVTDGTVNGNELDPGAPFEEWTAGQKLTAADVGKVIAARLVLNEGDDPYYVVAGTPGKVTTIATGDLKDWSVTINGTIITKSGNKTLQAADAYSITDLTLTTRDDQRITINPSVVTSDKLTVADSIQASQTVTFTFLAGFCGLDTTPLAISNLVLTPKSLSELISISSGTLTYDPTFANIEKKAAELVNAGNLVETTDFIVKLSNRSDGMTTLSAANANDTVYIVVKGAGTYAGYAPVVSGPMKISPKALNTLYVDQDALNAITYRASFDSYLQNQLETAVFKYYGADDAAYFDLSANSSEIALSFTTNTQAGQPITVTVAPVAGNANFTGSVSFTFTANSGDIPAGVQTALDTAIQNATFEYDGTNHAVNNLVDTGLDILTRGEYVLSCKEVPSGNIKNAGKYTVVLTVVNGPYKGTVLTSAQKLVVTPASLDVFKYGKGITSNPISWEPGLTNTIDLKEKAAPVLTFGNTKLIEGQDYTVNSLKAKTNGKAGDVVELDISAVAGGNFTGTNVLCSLGKVQARELPDFPDVPTQTYSAGLTSITNLVITKEDGSKGDYSELLVDIKGYGATVYALQTSDYEAKLSALPASGEGEMTLTIIGKGNYTGVVEKTFAVTKEALNATIKSIVDTNKLSNTLPTVDYTNAAAVAKGGIQYSAGAIFTGAIDTADGSSADQNKLVVIDENGDNVAGKCNFVYKNNTAAGTATIEAVGKTGVDIHAIATFEILPQQKVDADVTLTPALAASYPYTGEAIEPGVKISVSDSAYALKEGVDFEVSYMNNVNVNNVNDATDPATAGIVIKGLGNYTFVQSAPVPANKKANTGVIKPFVIAKTTITKEVITVNSVEYAGGLEVTPDITILNPNSGKALVKDVDYELELKNAVNAGIADATIKLTKDGADNYDLNDGTSSVAALTVKFEITKKALSSCTATIVDGKIVIKNGDVTVPASVYDEKVNEDGSITATAKATEKNYTGSITVTPGAEAEAPAATTLTVSGKTTSTIDLKWDAVEGADGYTIWYNSQTDPSLTRKVVSGGDVTSYTVKNLEAGVKYYFIVRSWVKTDDGFLFSEKSNEGKTVRGTTRPEAATIQTVKVGANGKVTVSLAGPAKGADGYAMCYSTTSSFKKTNLGINTTGTTRSFSKNLKPGTYYVKVRSYVKLSDGKLYGDWSNMKKIVVK